MLSTQPYKGTRDFYPDDMRIQNWMFAQVRQVVESFCFEEYDGPMLEPFELYAAKTGEEIVNQQLYSLIDRGERKLAIRPEMTPTLARMVAGRIHELPKPIRWFSIPNLWRYERPQKGRLREHWQLNVDILGGDPLYADAEILKVARDLMKALGGAEHVSIKINHRHLIDDFFKIKLGLGPEVALAACKAVDAKAKLPADVYTAQLAKAGISSEQQVQMEQFFSSKFSVVRNLVPGRGVDELSKLFALLGESGDGGQVHFDPTVMRGMDYYTGTVFEIYDHSPDNTRAMFGGGRYDNLVGLFGNHKLSGVGFGMGDVTLRHFLEGHKLLPKLDPACDVFITIPSAELFTRADELATQLRAAGLRAMTPLESAGFGVQLKQAAKLGARCVVLLGEAEIARGAVAIKELATGTQTEVLIAELGSWLTAR